MRNLIFYQIVIIGILLSGCSHTSELTGDTQPEIETDVNYSVIYHIHADSDYLYHDPDGHPVRKNSEVLETALEVGQSARSGEVFIYYQRPKRKLLGLFPRRSNQLYHYRGGRLINRVKYRHPDKKESFLATEAQLLNHYRIQNRTANHQSFFLFFGHEIPSENGKGYHRSLPGMDVNTVSFANGIQNFLPSDEDRFDLVVLSTCNNGTPSMAELLMPFSYAMLASPQNLHLSHIDSESMTLLEMEPGISSLQLGRAIAEQTYERMETTVHTTITLALYVFKDIRPYIHTLTSLTATNADSDRSVQLQDNVDCAEFAFPDSSMYRNGVETWYKPARFGRQSGRHTHSGWGCKPSER